MDGKEKKEMKTIVGVIGASEASKDLIEAAIEIGRGIAQKGWVLATGGLGGVMEAASRGAKEEGGTVVGILPTSSTTDANEYVDIPIATNMGHARNVIIAHTADALVAIGGGYGTLSEIAISKKLGKKVVGLHSWDIDGVESKTDAQSALKAIEETL
jgi:uncharacterized protein (TIGR00725 family)